MSDPVSKVEDVEDVLSSIRRLVSETSATASSRGSGGGEDMPDRPVADALILTSSHRVNAPKDEVETSAMPGQDDAKPNVTDLGMLRAAVSGDTASEQDGVDADDEISTDLPDASEGTSTTWAARAEDDYYEDEVEDISPAEMVDVLGSSDADIEEDLAASHVVEEMSAEDDFVIAEQTIEPDDISASDMSVEDAPDVTPMTATPERPASLVEEMGVATMMRRGSDATPQDATSEEIEEIEDAEFEDQGFASDNVADDTLDGDDEDLNILADFSDDVPSAIDEEMLRDIVTEIVREELGGELGERITRNVRKLVRREIHRAMLTREFE
jgi:hypothetical protein